MWIGSRSSGGEVEIDPIAIAPLPMVSISAGQTTPTMVFVGPCTLSNRLPREISWSSYP